MEQETKEEAIRRRAIKTMIDYTIKQKESLEKGNLAEAQEYAKLIAWRIKMIDTQIELAIKKDGHKNPKQTKTTNAGKSSAMAG